MMCVYVNELNDNLTEEEITAAISQMQKGRAPGLNGILTEILRLGGVESICFLRLLQMEYGEQRLCQVTGQSSCSYPSTKGDVILPVTTIMVLPF